MSREHAPITKESLSSYLPDRPVIVEAGAHIGRDTIKMAQTWPDARIHAFEPIKNIYNELLINTAPYTQIHCYNKALSTTTGRQKIYACTGEITSLTSLLQPGTYHTSKDRLSIEFTEQTVPTITLDDWSKDYYIPHIDLLWLDLQGAEKQVLASSKILETVMIIVLEVSLEERFIGEPLLEEMLSFIEAKGFKVVQQGPQRNNKCNLLCIVPELI